MAKETGQFDSASLKHLANLHFDLQRVHKLARTRFRYRIICSYRGKADQQAAKERGASNADFGQSPHNFIPPVATDCVPDPLNWNDKKSFDDMAAAIMQAAKELGIPIRSGADWDRDGKRWEKGENDGPHFELDPWRVYAEVNRGKT